jgi:hypothetical protein
MEAPSEQVIDHVVVKLYDREIIVLARFRVADLHRGEAVLRNVLGAAFLAPKESQVESVEALDLFRHNQCVVLTDWADHVYDRVEEDEGIYSSALSNRGIDVRKMF